MMFRKKIRKYNLLYLIGIFIIVFAFQNCGNIDLSHTSSNEKLSCDPSVYNITREAQTVNGQTVYFVQQNNHDISNEYAGAIDWTVKDRNGSVQAGVLIHENRLLLNCETHPEEVEITAKLITDCGTEIEIFHSDSAPNTCEEQPPLPPQPIAPGPETSYCEEYKQQYPGVEDVPGFDISKYGYSAIEAKFEEIVEHDPSQFSSWSQAPHVIPSIEQLSEELDNQAQANVPQASFLKVPSPYDRGENGVGGMRKKFIAIPIKVPETSRAKFLEIMLNRTGQYTVESPIDGVIRISISPCKGDFRFNNNGIGQPMNGPPQRSTYSISTLINFGNEDYPNIVKIPKGKTAYLNIAFYTFDNNYTTGMSNPVDPDFENGGKYTCPDKGEGIYDLLFHPFYRPCGAWMHGTIMER